ncbi:GGDEF domain-containing protein [Candidatus Omnitrophota bacterium]
MVILPHPKKDQLTGFFLREIFYSTLKKLLLAAGEGSGKKTFSLIIIDLDHFKKFNDTLGHLAGDDILEYMSEMLRLFFPEDMCFRYGGDEFIVILDNKAPEEAFNAIVELKNAMAQRPFFFQGKSYRSLKITISCGIAGFPDDALTTEDLVRRADEAMYFSKRHGRNSVILAKNVKHLAIRSMLKITGGTLAVVVLLFGIYIFILSDPLHQAIKTLKNIEIIKKGKAKDIVILKRGATLEGEIMKETEDKVIFNMFLDKGTGMVVLKKSDIAQIKYAPKD